MVLLEAGGDLLFHIVAAVNATISNLGGRWVGADVVDLASFLVRSREVRERTEVE